MKIEVIRRLPPEFDALANEATSAGHGFLFKMREEWQSGKNTFSLPGEILFAIKDELGGFAGVGGLNIDPYAGDPKIWRIRHVYIAQHFQRSGFGRLIVRRLLEHAKFQFDVVRLRTQNPKAVKFYETLGFEVDSSQEDPTHFYFIKLLRRAL